MYTFRIFYWNNYFFEILLLFALRWEGVVMCVWSVPILRIKGVMFSLRQLKMVPVPGTWDPCLSAGIGVEPAASLRARCCFIYLKAQVTFLEECSWEICLSGLSFYSPYPHFLSYTSLWRMKPWAKSVTRMSQKDPEMNFCNLFNSDAV